MLRTSEVQRWSCDCGNTITAPVRWFAAWCPHHKPDKLMTLVEGEMPHVPARKGNGVRSRPTARKTNMDTVIELLQGVAANGEE